jgi:hypothetical protein
MEKYNYAIQVADNVTDIMNLPCVMRCDKLMFGTYQKNAVQYRYLLDDGQEAVTYDWIVQLADGKWKVFSGAEWNERNKS